MVCKILFYGSFPKEGEQPFGGGEVGNMRTVRMLENAGYEVRKICKFKSGAKWGRTQKMITYPFRLFSGWMVFFFVLLSSSRKSLIHLSSFAGHNVFNDYVIMHIAKMLGYDVLYELRGGGAISYWETGAMLYRHMFAYVLRHACYIFIQGKENIPLITSVCNVPYYHYPNCVEDDFAPKVLAHKPADRWNLLFYGRLEEDKHVDLIVEAVAIVQKEVPNVYLTIVGQGHASYVNMVREKMERLLKPETHVLCPGCSHEELPHMLVDKHFYIFPSTQPLEGQSNSVTECMSFGVIPIASPQGFNRSTIGNDLLIVDSLTPEAYAKRITEIIQGGDYEKLSAQVRQRFIEEFAQRVVTDSTLAVYQKMLSQK